MGDALATYFEAKACQASNATSCAGGHITIAAITLAKVCYQTLIEDRRKGKTCSRSRRMHNSSRKSNRSQLHYYLVWDLRAAGLAAHMPSITDLPASKTVIIYIMVKKLPLVPLTQLVLENADEDLLDEVITFCMDVGLPTTFADLGIPTSR